MDIFPIRRPPDVTPETLVPDLSDGAEAGLYLALFELVEEGLIITSDETILEVNSAACHLLERTYPELVGQPLCDLFPSEAAFLAARGALFVEGASRGSLTLRMPDGERRHLRCLSAARVRPGVHALVLSPDTAGLSDPVPPRPLGDKVWPRLAAAVRQPVVVTDGAGRIRAANTTAQAQFARDGASLVGRSLDSIDFDASAARELPGPHAGWKVLILTGEAGPSARAPVVVHPADGRHRRAFTALPFPALLCDPESLRVVDANRAAEAAYGLDRTALLATSLSALQVEAAATEGRQHHRHSDGQAFEVDLLAQTIEQAGGQRELLLVHRPIHVPSPVERFGGELFVLNADGVLILDASFRIAAVNPAICRMTQRSRAQLLGQSADSLLAEGAESPFRGEALGSSGRVTVEQPLTLDGDPCAPCAIQVARVGRTTGQADHYLVSVRDLRERETLRRQAMEPDPVDAVTGLPDRQGLGGPYLDLASRSRTARRKLLLLVIDLVGFHRINAQLGEEAANQLLATVGERLAMNAPDEAAVARIGPDSFVVLAGSTSGADDGTAVASALLDAIGAPLPAGPTTVNLDAHIGIAVGPDHGEDLGRLLSSAEQALDAARREGDPVRLYRPTDAVDSLARLSLDAAIRRAPDRGELALHWQPRYSLTDATLIGAEALLRWNHPQLGLLDAEQFVPVALRSGSIDALGRWALSHACEQAAAWHDAYDCKLVVAINVSARELGRSGFADEVLGHVRQYALQPDLLEIELVECARLPESATAMAHLYALQEAGIRLRLDRFGSDGSPMSLLRHLPLSGLKIDPQFVRDLMLTDEGTVLIESILHTARALRLDAVAAGVEHAEQRDQLARLGCQASQGRLHGAPISAEAFGRILAAAYGRA
ncbi:MAG: EAL domain-containing protein [Rhodocyclaceae bacterium]|nr:EAL domain-containing protein [Rhodocyclaceae bacterium]